MVKARSRKVKRADPELLSVIVPAYKCPTIERDLKAIDEYLEGLGRAYEIICVVDGKAYPQDRTAEKAKRAKNDRVKVFVFKNNRGKGYAIRYGMARAKGGLIAFLDAGSDLHVNGLGLALEHVKWYNADVIIGSKRHKASKVNYPWKRRVLSFLVQRATRVWFGFNVSDTQTGLKVFRREVLEEVLPRLLVKRWAFDLEILTVANRLGYTRIYESPVELEFNALSNIRASSVKNFIVDYLAIIYRVYLLRYYDDDNIDIWENDRRLKLKFKLEKEWQPKVSVIVIDYKEDSPYLTKCLEEIGKQSYENYEIILLTDYISNLRFPKLRRKSYGRYVGPAKKRDDGAKMARGEILAFIDDDAYPTKDWLKELVKHFTQPIVAAVGGPGVTPDGANWQEAVSGWVSASPLGAGPYNYRFLPGRQRSVDDYPSMNLSVRKSDFIAVGGFDSNYWPGEDTKLCMDLVHRLGKRIIYDPKALVYHHRRELWKPHLRQHGNYGLHRGYFARALPRTSLRPSYFLPSVLVLGFGYLVVATGWPMLRWEPLYLIGLVGLVVYVGMLILNGCWVWYRSKNFAYGLVSVPAVFATHFWYGVRFLQGFVVVRKLSK